MITGSIRLLPPARLSSGAPKNIKGTGNSHGLWVNKLWCSLRSSPLDLVFNNSTSRPPSVTFLLIVSINLAYQTVVYYNAVVEYSCKSVVCSVLSPVSPIEYMSCMDFQFCIIITLRFVRWWWFVKDCKGDVWWWHATQVCKGYNH